MSLSKISEIVSSAEQYADAAFEESTKFLEGMTNLLFVPPTIKVTWSGLAAPPTIPLPPTPNLPTINFNTNSIPVPQPFVEPAPDIRIDDLDTAVPDIPDIPFPNVSYGAAPTIPELGQVTVPDAPNIVTPGAPSLLGIDIVGFGGLNLREDWVDKLEETPELTLVEPTPFSYSPRPEYSSALLQSLKDTLDLRLQGGTGLKPEVEAAIWQRGQDRETQISLANQDDILRQSDNLGFHLPPGTVAAQLRNAQRDYYGKLSSLSRDVAIKQAELEQQNLKDTVAAVIQHEGQIIDYSFKMEQLAFETAKTNADISLQAYTAGVEKFKALLAGYETYASVYKSIIDAEQTKVEVYKAQLEAERTKAEINKTLVDSYKVQIDAGMSQVEIFKAQLGGAQTLLQLEQAKIGAAGEQVRAYVAQINAETAKVEAFKAQVQAGAVKADIYRTTAQAFQAKSQVQAEKARVEMARFSALAQVKASEWEGYRSRIQAESERVQALGMQSNALLDGYRAANAAIVARSEMATKVWESNIRQYEAGQNIALQAAKINADNLIATNAARLDAAKVGAQTSAQKAASALGMVNASAGSTWSEGQSVSFNYTGETSTDIPPIRY